MLNPNHGPGRVLALAPRRIRRESLRLRYRVRPQETVETYLATHPIARLQIGAGPNSVPGWLNTDRDPVEGHAYLDATRRFPQPDGSLDYVWAEHTIEHFTWQQGLAMLKECQRVLKPGGRVRIATPDLERVAGLLTNDDPIARDYVRWSTETFLPNVDAVRPAHVVNQLFRGWGHRYLYDDETLAATMEQAGFSAPRRFPFGESDDPELHGIEAHGADERSKAMIRFETLVVQATKS
jgi:predicted SAM-dependent methyltransferase